MRIYDILVILHAFDIVNRIFPNGSTVLITKRLTYCSRSTCGIYGMVWSSKSICNDEGSPAFQLRSFATTFSFSCWSTTLEIFDVPYLRVGLAAYMIVYMEVSSYKKSPHGAMISQRLICSSHTDSIQSGTACPA